MMATDRIDASLPFTMRTEDDIGIDNGDTTNVDDINPLSMPLPLLSVENSVMHRESSEFLRLTEMVRAVYLSNLHKCLLSNYITCYERNDEDPSAIVKRCADQMELNAVRLALEANLYRKTMLKMIADIKSHTVNKKVYKKLLIFLEAPKEKIDVFVQTDDKCVDLHGTDNIQSVCITSNSEEMLRTTSPIVNSSNFNGNENITRDVNNEMDVQMSCDEDTLKEVFNDASQKTEDKSDSRVTADANAKGNEDENSQDSILQHMEDMFCESDDSSDLTKLIEKYSGVSKANIDREINEICLNATGPSIMSQSNKVSTVTNNISGAAIRNMSEGKVSYSRYKEMRSKRANVPNESDESEINDVRDTKQKERINAVWLVERVHQVSKLKTIMTELSMTNYRRHGMLKEKFLQLFGESDEEEMMPDSPICIEEHLSACKERIAPWIVKYLMPFYKKRKIKDRQLFKAVAKYIADMLIIKDTFPERECVSTYINNYFKNKKCIKTKQDIYL
ncbi:PREDICTED: uncharacterized protein LOC106748501 [Dinoponera quadriceps]|uniref:Uncharacterized protein LOC106748501 n=1 Tax=Dinoponera quadriceps TaxID=609295 RepID=A0A6P3XVM0_DINQU|nr:PREDICTED: uncharacterized protein LOC106748501 [Dinoponera quadriceps]